jgi:hypothetical protein
VGRPNASLYASLATACCRISLVARLSGVSRRLIQKWLGEKRLTAYSIAGDRRRFVDLDEIKKLKGTEANTRKGLGRLRLHLRSEMLGDAVT